MCQDRCLLTINEKRILSVVNEWGQAFDELERRTEPSKSPWEVRGDGPFVSVPLFMST